jgi:hypothetical protein
MPLPSVMMYRIPILFWRLPDTGPTAGKTWQGEREIAEKPKHKPSQ